MKFPQRVEQHVTETASIAIFKRAAPAVWVVRECSERDYGIDMYVELVGDDRQLVGHLAALQIKGVDGLMFSGRGAAAETVKRSTLNYWLGLGVPVFLISVCIETEKIYWASIDEQHREGLFTGDSETVRVKLSEKRRLTAIDLSAFWESYHRERQWPKIENCIEKSLMLFNTLGPLVLMGKRGANNEPCTTTLQYLFNQHYEHYQILSQYLLWKSAKPLSHWYEKNSGYAQSAGLPESPTFYYHTLKIMITEFVPGYRDVILVAHELVTETQSSYFEQAMPQLVLHLRSRPHTFIEPDWFARFYFDEYENETSSPKHLYFEDFEEFDAVLGEQGRT